MDKYFSDKVIWITGASMGIGAELARQLAPTSAKLILSAPDMDALEEVRIKLDRPKAQIYLLAFDLEQLEELPQISEKAWAIFGGIDILINNAGLAIRDYALKTELSMDLKLMKINYFGPVMLTKTILPIMIKRGHGHIVTLSTVAAKYGVPRTAAYSASKHALHGFFDSLRSELNETDIHITLILPGIIRTRITENAVKGDGSKHNKWETTFQHAYPVDKAVKQILRVIRKKKDEAFVGGADGITLWINRFWPALWRKIIRNHPIKKLRKFLAFISFGKWKY